MEVYVINEINHKFEVNENYDISFCGHIIIDRQEMKGRHVSQCNDKDSFDITFIEKTIPRDYNIKPYMNSILIIENQSIESIFDIIIMQNDIKNTFIDVVFWSIDDLDFKKSGNDIIDRILYAKIVRDNSLEIYIDDKDLTRYIYILVNDRSCIPFIDSYKENLDVLNLNILFTKNIYSLLEGDTIDSNRWINIVSSNDPFSFVNNMSKLDKVIIDDVKLDSSTIIKFNKIFH